jgi:type III pantothenate kinase
MPDAPNILAIDVGSSHVKLGWFPDNGSVSDDALPTPAALFRVDHRRPSSQWTDEVRQRFEELQLSDTVACVVASVQPRTAEALHRAVLNRCTWSALVTLAPKDLPIERRVDEPASVGIDRLLSALAANRLREPSRAAIVVDMGTATTVNLVAADGVFEGGAILAGPMTNLAALHAATASLPLLGHESLAAPPPAVGKSTERALAAGAYWGAAGAVRELMERMAATCATTPHALLTGGASAAFAPLLKLNDEPARHVPHLVLAGIWLAAQKLLDE